MASKAFRQLETLADRRRELRAELEALEVELRDATCDAVREGVPAAPAARLAGVSRETLYKWLRAQGVATETLAVERRLEARISTLEAKYEAKVSDAMGALEPAGDFSRRGNWRSGYQWAHSNSTSKRWQGRYDVSERELNRTHAEFGLELDTQGEQDANELTECRQRLLELREARLAF